MPTLFISHSSADKIIIDGIFDLLQTGGNIRTEEIICTSVDSAGIETGAEFVGWIHSHLQDTDLILLVVTPNYFASRFCVAEMGAAWALEKPVFPLVLPNLPRDIGSVMLGRQTAVIDERGLDDLRDRLAEIFPQANGATARWSLKKEQFLKEFRSNLDKLAFPPSVDRALFEQEQERTKEAMILYSEMQQENHKLREQIEALEKVKDREEVEEIRIRFSTIDEEYQHLVKTLYSELRSFSAVEIRCIYEHFIAGTWYPSIETLNDWGSEIDKAVNSNWIIDQSNDGPASYRLNPRHPRYPEVLDLLDLINTFIEEKMPEEMKGEIERNHRYLVDVNNQEYWEEVLYQRSFLD